MICSKYQSFTLFYMTSDNKIKNVWKSLAVHFVTITKCLTISSSACIVVVVFCHGKVASFCVANVWAQQLIPVSQNKLASVLAKMPSFWWDTASHSYKLFSKKVTLPNKYLHIYIYINKLLSSAYFLGLHKQIFKQ